VPLSPTSISDAQPIFTQNVHAAGAELLRDHRCALLRPADLVGARSLSVGETEQDEATSDYCGFPINRTMRVRS
jgi:hypothetical protein